MKSLISVLVVLVVAGCALPADNMTSNRYSNVVQKPVEKPYAGLWSGTSGSALMTLRIDKDGRGISCSSRDGKDSVSKLKLSDDTLYFQDGTKMALTYADGYIDGVSSSPSTDSQTIRFARDTGLINASPYCRERLQQPYL
ncbi:J517_1871 family lipoprotein [Eoetvoesiella caeni]